MSEQQAPIGGILGVLGEIYAEMQISGCSYDEAVQKREQRQRDEQEEFSNVINLADYRKLN